MTHRESIASVSGSPFIGRVRELAALKSSLPGENDSNGRFIALPGEAGIGKTRLLAAFADRARAGGHRVLWSQMVEAPVTPPYLPWRLALRSGIQHADDESLACDLGVGATDVAEIVPELKDRLDLDPRPGGSGAPAARYQLYDSVARFLLRAAARAPHVLLFDNLHSSDRSSLALLEYVCQQLIGNPLLIVAAYRESELGRQHPLRESLGRLGRGAGFLRLPLDGLSREEVAALLHARTDYPVPETLVRSVHRQSDGNPLFVTEVGTMLVQDGPESRAVAGGARFRVPESLREVVLARLDKLPDEISAMLATAAVVGREFDQHTLRDLSGIPSRRLMGLLERAQIASLIASVRPGHWVFRHALFREVLYEDHGTVARAMLHRRAAELLEHRYRDDPGPHLSSLAFHFFEAAQAGREQKAIHYCRLAAEAASAQRAYSEAVTSLDRALQVCNLAMHPDDDLRFSLLMAMGRAQYQAGELTAATQTLLRAALLAHRQHWWCRLADALFLFELICQQSGYHHVSSVPLHNAVLDHIGTADTALRAQVLASLAKAWRTAGKPERAAETFRQSIELARTVGDDGLLLGCLRKGNWTVGRNPARVQEGLEVAREANTLARRLGDAEATLDSTVDIIFQLCDLGEIDEVERQLVVLRELAVRERQPHFDNVLLGFEAAVALLHGEWVKGVRKAEEGLRRLSLQGVFGLQGRFGFQVFWIRKSLGTLGQLHETADRVISGIDDSARWLPGQILLDCELGQSARARAALRRLGSLSDLPQDDLSQIALAFLAEACVRLNDRKRCALLFELLKPYRGLNLTLGGTLMLGAAAGYLARLAGSLERDSTARDLYEEAIELNAAMRAQPALADTQVAYAGLLLRSRCEQDRTRAAKLMADARAIGCGLELRPVLRSLDELSDETGPASLTGREIDVLGKLADGSSNKVIARDLNISHSTVATHVRHIFRKIGVNNRTEAADFARRRGVLDSDWPST